MRKEEEERLRIEEAEAEKTDPSKSDSNCGKKDMTEEEEKKD